MTNEEKVAELEKEVAVLKAELGHLKDANKDLKQNHQELREKHHKLADGTSTHVELSKLLHIATPVLGILVGFIFNYINKKNNEDKIKTILDKAKSICNNCQEQTEIIK